MIVLGVNRGHNAAATLSVDGEVVLHLESERLNNIRYVDIAFPAMSVVKDYVPHVDYLALSGTTEGFKVFDNGFFQDAYTVFLKGQSRSLMEHQVYTIDLGGKHHLTHALSAHYGSGFEKSLCIVKDGMGSHVDTPMGDSREICTSYVIDNDGIFLVDRKLEIEELGLHSVDIGGNTTLTGSTSEGKAFIHIGMGLGFGGWDAGKVMGLSSYGKPSKRSFIRDGVIDRNDILYIKERRFEEMADIAYAIQTETEAHVISYILEMIEKTGVKDVTVSGGLFQNCVMNYKILKALPEGARLYVEPLSNDAGASMGAVDWVYRQYSDNYSNRRENLYLGTSPDYSVITNAAPATASDIAQMIADRKIVAIFQGKSEAGTRALGNRSILYDPRDENGKDRVNVVKKREWFRPFAGSVLHEHAREWFDMDKLEESPYMLYAVNVWKDKQALIPNITHVNETCRIQTVKRKQNENFYDLIDAFYRITGVPMVLNTSFNLAGDAIVETVDDALRTLYNSEIDALYLPDIGMVIKK